MIPVVVWVVTYAICAVFIGRLAYYELRPQWRDKTIKRGQIAAALFFTFTPVVNAIPFILLAIGGAMWIFEKLYKAFGLDKPVFPQNGSC